MTFGFTPKLDHSAMNHKQTNSSSSSLQEDLFTGSHKVSYRPRAQWDFEAVAEAAPIDIDLIMPPHRPRLQPENYRTNMLLSSAAGSLRAKVCRHALNRSFSLRISGGRGTNVEIWVPSNFTGFITLGTNVRQVSFSTTFVDKVLPQVQVNRSVSAAHMWIGDQIIVETGGNVTFRVWDVLTRAPESEIKHIQKSKRSSGGRWRRVFGGGKLVDSNPPRVSVMDWDFLIEDDVI